MVPKIVNRYTYKELNRIDGEIRLYDTPSGKLPSVTTILSSTETQEEKDGLQQWRDFVGHKTADLITKEASISATPYKLFAKDNPNDMWQADFKGN